jgi:ATP-binding cassette subfamily C (CFTR/MRP) protein 1
VLLIGIRISLLVLWVAHSATRASIPSAALSLVDATAILLISVLEHKRSVQPSSLLNVYLLFSILFDITTVRTLYLRSETQSILALSTAGIATQFILIILENGNKRKHLRLPYKNWPKEATSGVINRTFFWWLNNLFSIGFRKSLTVQDLYLLDPDMLSERLEEQMKQAWTKCRCGTHC